MIPKIIHYCWFGPNKIPNSLKKYIKTWKKYCPDYEIRCWTEKNYDVMQHTFVKSAYEAKAWAFVSDYVRLDVIYRYGGIYLDTDVELLKNLDFLLDNKCYIGIQQNQYLCTTGLGFGAEKGSQVVYSMLQKYNDLVFNEQNKMLFACPYLNDSVIKTYGQITNSDIIKMRDVTIYSPKFFDPISTGNTKNLLCKDTVSIHHYAATWSSNFERIKRKLILMLGDEKYYEIKKFFGKVN